MVRFPLSAKKSIPSSSLAAACLAAFAFSFASAAQDPAGEPARADDAPDVEAGTPSDTGADPSREELEALRAEVAELKARMDAADEEKLEALGATDRFEPSLDVYGFMAFFAGKWFIEDDNVLHGIVNDKLTFGITDLNLYFSGHLTETISSLVELRFTFLPHGAEQTFLPTYERIDNTYVDSNTTEDLTVGGVVIERVTGTWQPYDFFGISLGRFLTPFGIWNTDHGAPVVIPIIKPYLMLRHIVPLAQTGFMVHGRFFPAARTYFDYVVTLSNGRGPTEQVYDLDDNKAVGLRLRVSYEGEDVGVALGAYGYYGHTTDVTKAPDFGTGGISDFRMVETQTERYSEMTGSADLLVRLWGFRIQSEWAGGYIKYQVRPLSTVPIVKIDSPLGEYQPDYLRWDVYGMLAYEIPIGPAEHTMFLTPYAVVEYDIMYDSLPEYDTVVFRGGLNFKPNSFVVTKLDFTYLRLPNSEDIGDIWSLGFQFALTF